jgi:hypothetical protein
MADVETVIVMESAAHHKGALCEESICINAYQVRERYLNRERLILQVIEGVLPLIDYAKHPFRGKRSQN